MKKILIQLMAALSLTMSAFAVPHYHVTSIAAGEADGINNKGDVVGQLAIDTDNRTYFKGGHAFLYKGGKVIDLGVYPTARQPIADTTTGYAVNNSDLVVGAVYNAGGEYLSNSATSDDFIFTWQNGKMTVFPYGSGDGGYSSYATSINNQGNYVGTLDILTFDWAIGIKAIAPYGVGQAFINRNGVFTPLGVLNPSDPLFYTYSIAYGMNDANQAVGMSTSSVGLRGFLWMNGKMAAVGSTSLIPHAINDAGWIAGSDSNGASLYISGLTIKLGAGRALSLNNSGIVVGDILDSDTYTTSKAFIYVLGKRSDLTTLVDGGWAITAVGQINDFGQIAATGTKAGSTTSYALLLTPSF